MKRLLVSALGIALLLQAATALAYEDVGFDPDDRARIGSDPDIRSTARVVWRDDQGRGWLRIRITAYEPLSLWWFVTARLDSRGGPRTDYVMKLWNADMSGKGCLLYPRDHRGQSVKGQFRQGVNDSARCRVRLAWVDPTKRIRWRLLSESGYNEWNEDIAPNDGGFFR